MSKKVTSIKKSRAKQLLAEAIELHGRTIRSRSTKISLNQKVNSSNALLGALLRYDDLFGFDVDEKKPGELKIVGGKTVTGYTPKKKVN
jgi:hypothetical protein